MMKTVMIGDLAWPEYVTRVEVQRQPVLIPLGALEQHGPHMSMNPDVLIPTAIAKAVAERIGALVAPALAYGYKSQQKSGGGNHFPGTTSLDGATLSSAIKDLIKEFVRHGVRHLCLINGHFENSMFVIEGIDLALRELRWGGIANGKIILLSYWDFVNESTLSTIYPGGSPGWTVEHGGVLETSLMLHLHPDLVDMSLAPSHGPATFPPYEQFPLDPVWIPASGCLSSPAEATAAKGVLIFDVCVSGIAKSLSNIVKVSGDPPPLHAKERIV
jgi:creatinine amidohydrolase